MILKKVENKNMKNTRENIENLSTMINADLADILSEAVQCRAYTDEDIIYERKIAKSDYANNMFAVTEQGFDNWRLTIACISSASNNRCDFEVAICNNAYEFRCKDALNKAIEHVFDEVESTYRRTDKWVMSNRYQSLSYDDLLAILRTAIIELRVQAHDYTRHNVTLFDDYDLQSLCKAYAKQYTKTQVKKASSSRKKAK